MRSHVAVPLASFAVLLTLGSPTAAGDRTPALAAKAPCRVTGTLRRVPPPATRGVEPSPFRWRGTITLTLAPRVEVFRVEFAAPGATCTCRTGLPPALAGQKPVAFPWKPGAAQVLDVECSSPKKLTGTLGVVRIATSAEQASPQFSPAPPLPECSGRFGFE